MKARRDAKLDLRIAQALAAELERAAEAEGRTRSDVARRLLVQWASDRMLEREQVA